MKGFTRPEASILEDSALVPEANLIEPAPTNFTHQLKDAEPYYFQWGKQPNGEFAAGTKVLLMGKSGSHCRVADEQGLCVEVRCSSLEEL